MAYLKKEICLFPQMFFLQPAGIYNGQIESKQIETRSTDKFPT